MARIGTLAINVVANTSRFSTGLRSASRDVVGFTGVVNKSMRVLAPFSAMFGAGLVFGGAAAFVAAGKSANDFAGTMNRSLAIMQDVGPKMRREMELTAHSVAASTQFTAKETARAYFFLASAGMDAQQSMAALNQMALFGQAGNFDLATATDLATDAQSALGLKSKDAATNLANLTHVTDVLTRANTLGNASIQQFSEALTNKAGAAAKVYGLSMEEVLGMAIAFADQGVKGAEAGTRMSIVLRDLSTKAITNAKAFKEAGIEVWRYGEMLPPAAIFQTIETAMADMNGEAQKTLLMQLGFTDKSIAATQALLGYGKAMGEATEDLETLGMTAKSVAESSLTDFDKAWNRIASAIGKASEEVFTPILEQLAEMAREMDDVADSSRDIETIWDRIGKNTAKVADDYGAIAENALLGAKAAYAMAKFPGDLAAAAINTKEGQRIIFGGKERPGEQELFNADFWQNVLAEIKESTARSLGVPDLVGGSLENLRRRGFDVDRVKLPDLTTEEKIGMQTAEEAADAAAKLVLEGGKSLSEALDKVAAETRHKRFERDKARDLAAGRLVVEMRTAGEAFESKLVDLERLLKSGVPGIDTAVMRKAAEAKADFLGTGKREADRLTPGLNPAVLAGSVAAAEAVAQSMQTSFPVRAAESTAANTAITAQLTPLMVRLLEQINRKAGQPDTVETGAL